MAPKRIRIGRILCPTDFSEFSLRALERAVSLARWFEARVTALHVLPRPLVLPVGAIMPDLGVPMDLLRAQRQQGETTLGRWIEPFLGEGVPIETRLVEGDPWREIQAAAEALPADLVIMGTHGRSGFEHLLLGSVTEKVLRRAPCPVLAVGAKDIASSPGPLFHRILCAVDLTAASQATLDFALSLAGENLARVTLLHVVENLLGEVAPELYRRIPDVPSMGHTLVGQAREQLHEAGRTAHGFCDVSELVETGKAWQAILRVAKERCADLIVMGAHAHGGLERLFFGSTADQVVRQAPCPVLVVREATARRESDADSVFAASPVGVPGA